MISFKGRHHQQDIILQCVRWYVAFSISYRDLEELMRERGYARCGSSPPFTERHWQGGLHLEGTVPGWNDPGSVRAGGFHRTVGSPGAQTKG